MSLHADQLTPGTLSGLRGTYRYLRRGTRDPLPPDLEPDRTDPGTGGIPFAEGSLFREGASVAWSGPAILDQAVDIEIRLPKRVFVDCLRIRVDVSAVSGPRCIEVLTARDGRSFRPATRSATPGKIMREDGRIECVLSAEASALILRIHGDCRTVALAGLELFGCSLDAPLVFPTPQAAAFRPEDEDFSIDGDAVIRIGPGADADVRFAANHLTDRLREERGLALPVLDCHDTGSDRGTQILLEKETGPTESESILPEGFRLRAEAGVVTITARDRRGLLYAAEALLALLRDGDRRSCVLPACRIEDAPAMAVRGIHLGLPPRSEIGFFKRFVRHVLAPLRYNTIFLEFAGGMRFASHPEISEAWIESNRRAALGEVPPVPHGTMVAGGECLTADEVRSLADTARAYGIEVIPEVQSLSHVQFLTLAHPEVAEIPARPIREPGKTDLAREDEPPAAVYAHCSCVLSEEAYRIQFDLIDEIADAVGSVRSVHMGHDEVYQIGVCERCRSHDPADLFALHVRRMHAHLAEKGLRMMIWADMLHDCTRYRTPPAIDRLPKDLVLLDFIWYFHLDRDIETRLLDRGFDVLIGNLYSSHFPRFEQRRSRPGLVGAQVSTWVRADEYHLAVNGKIFDLLYTANMMWSAAYDSRLRRCYTRHIASMLPRLRGRLRGEVQPSLDPASVFTPFPFPGQTIRAGQVLRGIPFLPGKPIRVRSRHARGGRLPSESSLSLGVTCDSLVLLHACEGSAPRIPWKPLAKIAAYIAVYADGGEETIPVEYGGTLAASDRLFADPLPHPMYRHQGYLATYLADPLVERRTPAGDPFTAYALEWINPRPGVSITRLIVRAKGETDATLHLLALTAVCCNTRSPANA